MPPIAREKRTVEVMIGVYCRGRHGRRKGLCPECEALRLYAMARLDRCTYGDAKPTCAQCPIHCYKPSKRAEIRDVMRYAGPRMLLRHPLMALAHRWEALRARKSPPPDRKHHP